jgi:hypothetical protein
MKCMKYTEEIWKNIPDLNGYYQCSNFGRIKSMQRIVSLGNNNRLVKDKILTPIKASHGYLVVNITYPTRKQFLVHKLIAKTFLNYKQGLVINHIDLDKTNNNIENLEAITQKENIEHSILNDMNGQILLDTQNGIYYTRYCEAANAKNISLNKFYKTMAKNNNYNLIKV